MTAFQRLLCWQINKVPTNTSLRVCHAPFPPIYIYYQVYIIGCVVGRQGRCNNTWRSTHGLQSTNNQGTYRYVFWAVIHIYLAIEHKGNNRITLLIVFTVRHPRGSYILYPHCCLWKWPHRKVYQSIHAVNPYAKVYLTSGF